MKPSKMKQTYNSQAQFQKAFNEAQKDKAQVESQRRADNMKKYGKGLNG